MAWLIVLLLVYLAVAMPQWWVKRVLKRYESPKDRYPGTGGELARHLLDRLGLESVAVENLTDERRFIGDHYDPKARAVRLLPAHFDGASLTAITVAAHEVGHAIQHADGYRPLIWRTLLVEWMQKIQRLGWVLIALAPIALVALRVPRAGIVLLFVGIAALLSGIVIHLMTLPTELDASFRRALPLLVRGSYLKPGDEPHAKKILTAASMTYVAASMMGLINFWWWLRVLRVP
jgi:Zn-dependent membrane protease YugP